MPSYHCSVIGRWNQAELRGAGAWTHGLLFARYSFYPLSSSSSHSSYTSFMSASASYSEVCVVSASTQNKQAVFASSRAPHTSASPLQPSSQLASLQWTMNYLTCLINWSVKSRRADTRPVLRILEFPVTPSSDRQVGAQRWHLMTGVGVNTGHWDFCDVWALNRACYIVDAQ